MTFSKVLTGLAAGAMLLAAGSAQAADWKPAGTLHLQIGFGAGGSTDALGRIVAKVLKEQTGWNVIAENKPGGGGIAMFTKIAASKPDGTVIGLGVNMPVMINLVLRGDKLTFTADSFDYLGTVARAPLAIVARKDAPFNDLAGLVAYAREKGGAPVGFDAKPQQLIMANVAKTSGAKFKMVSTKGEAEVIKLLLGGQIVAGFAAGTHIPYLERGELKMLASANDGRHNYAPDAKTVREQGFNVYVDPIFYFAAPAGLPADAKKALADALAEAIASDEAKDVVKKTLSTEVNNLGPDGTKSMIVDGLANIKVLFGK